MFVFKDKTRGIYKWNSTIPTNNLMLIIQLIFAIIKDPIEVKTMAKSKKYFKLDSKYKVEFVDLVEKIPFVDDTTTNSLLQSEYNLMKMASTKKDFIQRGIEEVGLLTKNPIEYNQIFNSISSENDAKTVEEYLRLKFKKETKCERGSIRLPGTGDDYTNVFHDDSSTLSCWSRGRLIGNHHQQWLQRACDMQKSAFYGSRVDMDQYEDNQMLNVWFVLQDTPVVENPLGFANRVVAYKPYIDDENYYVYKAYYTPNMVFGQFYVFDSIKVPHANLDFGNGRKDRISFEVRCLVKKQPKK